MAEAQIKLALNALANAEIEVREHDDKGADVGEVTELKPGKSATFSLAEGHTVVAILGAAAEPPKKGNPESPIITVSVEKDSTNGAKLNLRQGVNILDDREIGSDDEVKMTLGDDIKLRIGRGGKNPGRAEPAPEPTTE